MGTQTLLAANKDFHHEAHQDHEATIQTEWSEGISDIEGKILSKPQVRL